MQVCTVACGNTAVIASGKPLRPSTTAISTSSTPRFLISFMTRSQNLAPSFCSSQSPRISLLPSARTPSAMWTDQPFIADLDPQRVKEDQRIDRFQRARLPGGDLIEHRVGDGADQIGRDVDAVEIAQMADNLAGAHAAGVHRDDLVVEPREAALIFGDQLRIETGLAIARHRQLDPAG